MLFIKYPDNTWWELDKKNMRVFNINNGHHNITEKTIAECKIAEYENWHDLFIKTGYNPLIDNRMWHTGWISPYGEFYPCEAHEVDAETIYNLIYGEEHGCYGDKLIKRGWIKVTNSLMFDIYKDNGHYNRIPFGAQKEMFDKWYKTYIERNKTNV